MDGRNVRTNGHLRPASDYDSGHINMQQILLQYFVLFKNCNYLN